MSGFADLVSTKINSRVGRWQDSARRARAGINAAKPPVRVETGPALPGWAYRIGCLVFGVGVIIAFGPGVVLIVILSLLLALVLVRPSTGTAAVFCGGIGLFWMLEPSPANSLAQIAILALAPALWMLAGVIADLGLRTRVELAVLRVPAIRYLILQAVGQPVLILTELLKTRSSGFDETFAGAVALVIVAIIAIAAWLLFPRIGRDQD